MQSPEYPHPNIVCDYAEPRKLDRSRIRAFKFAPGNLSQADGLSAAFQGVGRLVIMRRPICNRPPGGNTPPRQYAAQKPSQGLPHFRQMVVKPKCCKRDGSRIGRLQRFGFFPQARQSCGRSSSFPSLHTLLDLRGSIPAFIRITDGKVHDVNILDEIFPEAGAFYVMDRGYIDFERLHLFTLCSAFFVVRTKENILLERRYSNPVDKRAGVRSDQTVILTAIESAKIYPDPLRRVSFYDADTDRRLKFLTNNFMLPALTIAQIYKSRWQVELFFRWIKQHLRIKAFFGTSENAVKTQIWIAVSVYVLVAIVRKRLGLEGSLYQILQILSLALFEKMPILQALQPSDSQNESGENRNQLILFDF